MMPAAKTMKKHPSLYWINCTRLGCPKAMKDDGFSRPQTNGQMHRKAESDHFLQPEDRSHRKSRNRQICSLLRWRAYRSELQEPDQWYRS